jgi:hypothetical protein
MKSVLALACLGVLVMIAYKMHQEHSALLERSGNAAPDAATVHAINLSRPLEPVIVEVFSAIDTGSREDLAPHLELARERIRDGLERVPAGEQPIFQVATQLVDVLIAVARERSKAVAALVRAERAKPALETHNTVEPVQNFFVNASIRRWEEQAKTLKPRADQILARLREMEREWNRHASRGAPLDSFSMPRRRLGGANR